MTPEFIANELPLSAPGQSQSPASGTTPGPGQASPPFAKPEDHAPAPDPLSEATAFYGKGDFDHAIAKYRQVLQEKPNSPDAYAGLTRVYLKKKDVEQANDTVTKALQVADSPAVRVALGEVYFRQGRIEEAEREWMNVLNSGHRNARACLGLARVRWAVSMYKSGWTLIERAHQLDPTDPEIRMLWIGRQSRPARMKYLEESLADESNGDAESRASMRHYLEYLKARAKDGGDNCHLVSKATTSETKLVRMLIDPTHLHGYGLTVMVNGEKSKLLLDTGALGILINRSLARKAGVTKLSDTVIRGIGDKGDRSGYVGLANSFNIGYLEFQNCTVDVLDQRSVAGEDGLIGADVFGSFLVEIDFPNEKLLLGALPKRPQEATAEIALQTESDDSDAPEEHAAEKTSEATPAKSIPPPGPRDRYIAPEMRSYTPVYRFGHDLLLPTSIGDAPVKLFLLDTGAFSSNISPSAADEVTKVHGDPDMIVKGLNGSVNQVFRADKSLIRFGNVRQKILDLTAFNLTSISDGVGTEVSGILGFTTLRYLDIKIDYRDGLIDFTYDPKRWEH